MTTFDLAKVRAAFPALQQGSGSANRVHLDNPAGTQVPAMVAEAITDAILHRNANLGGAFATSRLSGEIWHAAHASMAAFLGADSHEEIVIGPNMTTLTYHLSRAIGRDWGPGDEIVCTRMDHEGNVGPWMQIAADKGATIRFVPFSTDSWQVEPEALAQVLSDRTRLVALNHTSNLTGCINDVTTLCAMIREAGALSYVDAVQYAPHGLVDVGRIGCDFLACSAYKFFGPHLGIVWGRREVLDRMVPYKLRCSTDKLPGRLEIGTPQIELLAGLDATVRYFEGMGGDGTARDRIVAAHQAMAPYEARLTEQLVAGLAGLDGVTVQGITDPRRLAWRVPTVSVTVADIVPASIATLLARDGIFVWSGHNYAWEPVHQLGIDPGEGVLRIGAAHYNSEEEVALAVQAVGEAISTLRQVH